MITPDEYFSAWLYYGIGGLVLSACWWFLISKIPSLVAKILLQVAAMTLIFFPWYTSKEADFLTPAWLIVAVEGLTDGLEGMNRAGIPLLIGLGVALLLTGLVIAGLFFSKRKKV